MKIETWECKENDKQEVHHFVEGELNTYIFGMNVQLLGERCYQDIRKQIEQRLLCLEHSPFKFTK